MIDGRAGRARVALRDLRMKRRLFIDYFLQGISV
jgi:hypothetical protein